MDDLTPETIERLRLLFKRAKVVKFSTVDGSPQVAVWVGDSIDAELFSRALPALLRAAEERDRLLRRVQQLRNALHGNGVDDVLEAVDGKWSDEEEARYRQAIAVLGLESGHG